MNKMLKSLLIILLSSIFILSSSTSLAQAAPGATPAPAPQAVPLTKGQPAPFDGLELTNDAANKNQVKLQQGVLATQQVQLLQQAGAAKDVQIKDLTNAYNMSEQRSDLFSKEATAEYDQIQKDRSNDTLKTVLLFGGGVVTTILIDMIVTSVKKNN